MCRLAKAFHPNIIVIHDIGTHEGIPYLVSELLEGETLRSRLNRGALPLSKVLEYGLGVANGLAAALRSSVRHRQPRRHTLRSSPPEDVRSTVQRSYRLPTRSRRWTRRCPAVCSPASLWHLTKSLPTPWRRIANPIATLRPRPSPTTFSQCSQPHRPAPPSAPRSRARKPSTPTATA
jgi:hypothetical protein